MGTSEVLSHHSPRPWGLIILLIAVGAILASVGAIIGRTSHQVVYQKVGPGVIAHYIVGHSTGYLQMAGSTTLYIVDELSFSPAFNANALGDGNISLIYRSDDTTYIDIIGVRGNDITGFQGTHLVGKAYKVIEITVLDHGQKVYVTSEYSQNPQGFYQNNWDIGAVLLVIGLAIAGPAFFIPKRIFTVLVWTLAGAVVFSLLFSIYVAISVTSFTSAGSFSFDSFKAAFTEDLTTPVITGLIGAIIGLIFGVERTIKGEDIL